MPKIVNKTVKLDLVGLNGNAFNLLSKFRRQAQKEKWLKDEIDAVLAEAMKSDYNHLLATLMDYCDE